MDLKRTKNNNKKDTAEVIAPTYKGCIQVIKQIRTREAEETNGICGEMIKIGRKELIERLHTFHFKRMVKWNDKYQYQRRVTSRYATTTETLEQKTKNCHKYKDLFHQ